ncbi:MAG: histidine phosphatase family protein [Bacteroidetes bacterium]|nr:histidine phosphatase family protein [Bacteroidota bacterium]
MSDPPIHKTILFFRHAKSDWNASYDQDHDRPLNLRGKRAASAMGRWLTHTGPIPDLILCSTAIRARTTCTLASESGQWTSEIQYERGLYHAGPSELFYYIGEVSEDIHTIMLVGHQPTWSATTSIVSGQMIKEFPTASMARIDLLVEEWEHCGAGSGKLIWHQFPKRLPEHYYGLS